MTYNPDDLNEQAQEAEENVEGLTGEIVAIEEGTAEDFFGDDVQGDADKDMIAVEIDTEGGDTITEYFSQPQNEMSWVNPTFRLARYKAAYGSVPEVGQEVRLTVNADGFLAVDMPETLQD